MAPEPRARSEEVSVQEKVPPLGISPSTCPSWTPRLPTATCSPQTPARCSFQYNLYWGD